MKQLHFTRAGTMRVAYSGNYRLVLHRVGAKYRAEVYERNSKKPTPLQSLGDVSKAEAVDFLARWMERKTA